MDTSTARYAVVPDWGEQPPGARSADAAGVAVAPDDRVYVLTRMPARVLVYEPDGRFAAVWGQGLFSDRAHGITVGPDGTVYCVDDGRHVVRILDPDGRLRGTLGSEDAPSDTGYDGATLTSIRHGGPPFNRPTNLAVGRDGHLYVTDGYGNCRVHRFTADGEHVGSWGEPGTGPGQFHLVHGIAALPDGRLLVADRENDRVQVFAEDGTHLDTWLDVRRPTQLAYDPTRGTVVVAELCWQPGQRSYRFGQIRTSLPSRVTVLDLDGEPVDRWGGADPCAPGGFVAAHGVAVDSAGCVYVAEVTWTIGVSRGLVPDGCHTLQKFTPTAKAAGRPGP